MGWLLFFFFPFLLHSRRCFPLSFPLSLISVPLGGDLMWSAGVLYHLFLLSFLDPQRWTGSCCILCRCIARRFFAGILGGHVLLMHGKHGVPGG
ncbi:hypothetical protein B0I37DRAFT_378911 [Chaetomium sp. MPI-CAGE-AT-0009]|nr:hypothetical protein B0I37DRAFT_378911 [Chaetomium sp. MPI-CAGE-AT-0009]